MRILFSFFIFLISISPIFGSEPLIQEKNTDAIVNKTFVNNPKMKELFYMIAAKKIAESGKKIDTQTFINALQKEMEAEENKKMLSNPYTKRYTPEEISNIRLLVENKIFDKYTEDSFEIVQESLQALDSIIDGLIKKTEAQTRTASTQLIEIKSDNFEQVIINSKLPVVLDFYADWCEPCKGMEIILEELNEEYKDHIRFARLDTVAQKEIADKFKIQDLPVVLFIKDGKIAKIHSGFADKQTLVNYIKSLI